MKTPKPPKKLSELIKLALHDLELCEAQPEVYVIKPWVWHTPLGWRDMCGICFAGAIMAKTLNTNHSVMASRSNYGERWKDCFNAVEFVRRGWLRHAAKKFGIDFADFDGVSDVDIPDMAKHPAEFKAAMREIISILEARGL